MSADPDQWCQLNALDRALIFTADRPLLLNSMVFAVVWLAIAALCVGVGALLGLLFGDTETGIACGAIVAASAAAPAALEYEWRRPLP